MSFGVISLLGTAQSKRIWDLLYDQLGPDLVAQRQIRCGEAANFQGDERDVIVLSTVVAVDPGARSTRFSAMTGTPALRRINVAASRARNQMWVVTSVDPQSLPNGDLRAELIRHCAAPPAGEDRQQDILASCESEFERRVVSSLHARGYRAIEVQHKVGQYRLDIVVAGPNGRLAIECDGDRWHGEDVWHKDRARQEVLERAGWTFERIRGSSFFRNPEVAMEPVWRHLDSLGIPTGDEWIVNSPRAITREVSGTPEKRIAEPAHFRRDVPEPEQQPDIALVPDLVASSVDASESAVLTDGKTVDPPVAGQDWSPPAWFLAGRDTDSGHLPAQPVGQSSQTASPESPTKDFQPPAWYTSPDIAPVKNPPAGRTSLESRPSRGVNNSASSSYLQPFRTWPTRQLPPVDSDNAARVMAGLAEIIEAEGPMHAAQAYQRYAKAAGGHRVGREVHRTFDALNVRGVRTGQWLRIKDRVTNPSGATLYAPGSPPVVVRQRGPRELMDIPRSEIRALMDALELEASPSELKRAVLKELGFVRMTERTIDYLDQCLRYKWTT
jgi:very-short-patch-repair endonuclease